MVSPRCVSLTISNEQNDDSGQLFFDLTCELEGEVTRNVDYRLTSDCYSTKYETDEEYRTIDIYSSTRAQGVPFSINESVKRKSKDIDEIIVYRWNRVYPSDFSCNADFSQFTVKSEAELQGSSHEKISKIIYGR